MAPRRAKGKATDYSAPPRDATEQLSYTGTPRYRSETTPDEYVRDLQDPVKRMEIFDEMRSSDESINTAIAAREQLIGSANWALTTETDTPAAREVLEFCEDNIYPVLPEMLRHLGGAIQYGFGVVEKVFDWADRPFARQVARGKLRRPTRTTGRRIYLRKLAHIRQRTVSTFVVPERGDLESLRQYVYSDGAGFRKVDVDVNRLLLWTYNRRGDDYWGVPPTRHAYKAWKLKTQIEKLNLIGFDRFGTGTPVAEEGENWSEPERVKLAEFLKNWRSGTNSFLVHPFGGKIELVSGDGKMVLSALEWVRYYALGIAKTYLTQGTELGSTETGARALGETFYEQTESIVQSDCEDIANIINEHLIIPLVDWNFGPQESYPAFAPSQRVRKSPAVATVISDLIAAGAVKWDESDEAWLRDTLDWPDINLDARAEKEAERQRLLNSVRPQLALPPGTPAETNPAIGQLRALRGELTEGAPSPAVAGRTTHRTAEYTDWEARILRPDVVVRDLDTAALRLTGEVQDVLREIDMELRDSADALARRGPEAIAAGIRSIAVSGKLRKKLRTVLHTAADRARAYGSDTVKSEVARQIAPAGVEPARRPEVATAFRALASDFERALLATDPTPEERARELALDAEIDRTAEDEVDRRERSVRDSLLNSIAFAGALSIVKLADVVRTAVQAALESLSTARTADNVTGVVNAGFGVGRKDAAAELVRHPPIVPEGSGRTGAAGRVVGHINRIVDKIYSAVMDFGTCDECAKWDGGVFPLDYPEDYTGVAAPNPRCAGSLKRCRCVWIYRTEAEAQSAVPPSKGPLPMQEAA